MRGINSNHGTPSGSPEEPLSRLLITHDLAAIPWIFASARQVRSYQPHMKAQSPPRLLIALHYLAYVSPEPPRHRPARLEDPDIPGHHAFFLPRVPYLLGLDNITEMTGTNILGQGAEMDRLRHEMRATMFDGQRAEAGALGRNGDGNGDRASPSDRDSPWPSLVGRPTLLRKRWCPRCCMM